MLTNYTTRIKNVLFHTESAEKIASKIFSKKKEYEKKINKAIDAYFNNKLIKSRYTIFEENLIPNQNSHTPGIWNWLNFDLVGVKRSFHESTGVGVELYLDGKIKNPRISEFVKSIQCTNSQCKPSVNKMQERLNLISDFENKVKKFDGTKLPHLKEMFEVQKEGYAYRKKHSMVSL
ncbi:MAG TPA: hypothetical protein VNX68_04230, partial [Nitrosopumilaceae archaeon]|nr:hypothetical protein [Nitrosopumilaceae archaeon]